MAFERLAIDLHGDSILALHGYPNKTVLDTTTVQYQVSSNVLRASSPYFEAIFKHSFAESLPVSAQYRFTAHKFDAIALKYVLIALHTPSAPVYADSRKGDRIQDVWDGLLVPRIVPLDILIAMADILEYYQIKTLNHVIVESWFAPYKNDKGKWHVLPRMYSKEFGGELMMWLALGSRFGVTSLCEQIAEIICATCLRSVEDFGWPVPREVLDALDREISRRLRGDVTARARAQGV